MRQDEEGIHLSLKEYCALVNASKKYDALMQCGVDSWQGYDDAMSIVKLDDPDS